MKIRLAVIAVAMASLSMTGTVQADELKAQVEECAQMKANLHRLSCYDDLAKSMGIKLARTKSYTKKATATVAATASTAEVVKNASVEDSFGVEHVTKVEGPDEIRLVIASAVKNQYDQFKFKFEGGQVWQQKDTNRSANFKAGDNVIIERGTFGSFFLKKVGTNRTIKVKRIK